MFKETLAFKFFQDIIVTAPFPMRDGARRAIFGSVGEEGEVTSASVSERIERAKAEETIELLRLHALVAGKIFARIVAEKLVAHPYAFC